LLALGKRGTAAGAGVVSAAFVGVGVGSATFAGAAITALLGLGEAATGVRGSRSKQAHPASVQQEDQKETDVHTDERFTATRRFPKVGTRRLLLSSPALLN